MQLPYDKCWIRYDPTEVSISGSPEGKQDHVELPGAWQQKAPDEVFITVADPITEAQAAYFANSAGWLVLIHLCSQKKMPVFVMPIHN